MLKQTHLLSSVSVKLRNYLMNSEIFFIQFKEFIDHQIRVMGIFH